MLPRTATLACKTLDPGIMYMSQSFDMSSHMTLHKPGKSLFLSLSEPNTASITVLYSVQVHVLKGQRTLRRADPIDWELAWAASCQQRYLCTYTA